MGASHPLVMPIVGRAAFRAVTLTRVAAEESQGQGSAGTAHAGPGK